MLRPLVSSALPYEILRPKVLSIVFHFFFPFPFVFFIHRTAAVLSNLFVRVMERTEEEHTCADDESRLPAGDRRVHS